MLSVNITLHTSFHGSFNVQNWLLNAVRSSCTVHIRTLRLLTGIGNHHCSLFKINVIFHFIDLHEHFIFYFCLSLFSSNVHLFGFSTSFVFSFLKNHLFSVLFIPSCFDELFLIFNCLSLILLLNLLSMSMYYTSMIYNCRYVYILHI